MVVWCPHTLRLDSLFYCRRSDWRMVQRCWNAHCCWSRSRQWLWLVSISRWLLVCLWKRQCLKIQKKKNSKLKKPMRRAANGFQFVTALGRISAQRPDQRLQLSPPLWPWKKRSNPLKTVHLSVSVQRLTSAQRCLTAGSICAQNRQTRRP